MLRRPLFTIRFDRLVLEHFNLIERKHHSLLRQTIDEQLSYEPLHETRNRKPLSQDTQSGATWELRCGPNNRFRIFYKVDLDAKIVFVSAVVVKIGNTLYAGEETFIP